MAAQEESGRSYLSKLSPWARSSTVAPSRGKEGEPQTAPLQQQKGADHVISHRHRLSLRKYPRDCPGLRPQWFHAVDVPKRRPNLSGVVKTDEKSPGIPKKYAAFSTTDSKSIETAFQRLLEKEDADDRPNEHDGDIAYGRSDGKPNMSLQERRSSKTSIKVPVNEDYLFDVDVEERELGPAYWHGPIYDVRRGTWFYQDGNVQRPCDENLAAQLEEGFLKVKAWKLPPPQKDAPTKPRSASQPRSRPASWTPGQDITSLTEQTVSAKGSSSDLRKKAVEDSASSKAVDSVKEEHSQNTYRLFGAHMNSVVTYQDGTTAWLLTDDWMTRMNYTVYQRFTTGFAGIKITRGWVNPDEKKDSKEEKATKTAEDKFKDSGDKQKGEDVEESKAERVSTSENMRQTLQRQMSALMEDSGHSEDRAKQEEEARKRDEREIEDDYREIEGDEQGREIEHLILVTHGIGQRLGLRLESVNFVHDVNTLRKTIKAVYAESPDLRALNAELDDAESVNSRVQVLPICWRHLLDFPRQSLRHNRKEHDLGDTDVDEDAYPNLEDITLDGVPFARQLIGDLALDILLYDSPAYKDHISGLVLSELNRIYHLFMERNPKFTGKISFVGHSLGSAIMFDILCKQDQPPKSRGEPSIKLDFPVEDFYALGSPIGLFQMLNGRTITARPETDRRDRAGSNGRVVDDAVLGGTLRKQKDASATHVQGENPVARPKCDQIFNIFHPTDPISYRIEPLISPAMASLKPQPLPYTKRGLFGAPVGQGLTGIGTRVSSSVSSMWTSMASSLLTRGLGYGEDATKAGVVAAKSSVPLSKGRGTNVASASSGAGTNVAAGVIPTAPLPVKGTAITPIGEDKVIQIAADAQASHDNQLHPPTLIDNEITTLYGDFEKRRKSTQSDSETRDLGAGATRGTPEWAEAEERGKRLRREEEKVRRLNSNGRVDYAIQEGAFDINLIAAIASHLSYWSDEDVSHFIISQLLSRHRVVRPLAESGSGGSTGRQK